MRWEVEEVVADGGSTVNFTLRLSQFRSHLGPLSPPALNRLFHFPLALPGPGPLTCGLCNVAGCGCQHVLLLPASLTQLLGCLGGDTKRVEDPPPLTDSIIARVADVAFLQAPRHVRATSVYPVYLPTDNNAEPPPSQPLPLPFPSPPYQLVPMLPASPQASEPPSPCLSISSGSRCHNPNIISIIPVFTPALFVSVCWLLNVPATC